MCPLPDVSSARTTLPAGNSRARAFAATILIQPKTVMGGLELR